MLATIQHPENESVAEQVLERLLGAIFSGEYPPGARLPAERDLVLQHGASRVSVREALQRLSEWNVISVRRGSGAVVRSRREWTVDVLPSFLRQNILREGPGPVGALLRDALEMRHTIILDTIARIPARRLDPERVEAARKAITRAWEQRSNLLEFIGNELEMLRCLLEAANMPVGVWILNTLTGVYLELLASFPLQIPIPENHLEANLAFIDALAAGEFEKGRKIMSAYLKKQDARILKLMGG